MIVSEYIAEFLAKKGMKEVFFIEGSACAALIVAFARNKKLKYYCPLHEQAGAFAADGFYKSSKKMTVMLATSGPGGQNLLNGVAASYYDSIPNFFIVGQVNSRFIKPTDKIRQIGFQECDIVSMAKPITKFAITVYKAKDILYELEKAYYFATSGRPGPVLVEVPMDVQREKIPDKLRKFTPPPTPKPELDKVSRCIEMFNKAKRPAILLGGGVWLADACDDAKKLARVLKKVPFFVTWNMIDYYDPEYVGGKIGTYGGNGRNFGIQNCDFLLAIGSRISGRITGGMVHTFARGAKKVIVDIDKYELQYQQVKGDLNITCDAKVFINELIKQIKNFNNFGQNFNSDWLKMVLDWKNKYKVVRDEFYNQKGSVNPYVFVKTLCKMINDDDVLVHEAGGNCVITSQTFEPKSSKQRVFTNNGNSSLGYAFPASIGAAIATKKKVNCIVGDGGFNFNIQELQTLKYHNLPVKVFIFDNRAFGITKAYRDTHFQSEYAGVDAEHGVSFPDFVKVAKAYGIEGVYIKDHNELEKKLKYVLDSDKPIICDVNMVGFYDYQPRLGWGTPIEDQYPFLPRDEFRKNMIIEPWEGWENPQYPGPVR
jgi:acetolactate synthase-1/2/3 large subunit